MPSLPAQARSTIVTLSLGLALLCVGPASHATASPPTAKSAISAEDISARSAPKPLSRARKLKLAKKALGKSKQAKLSEFPASLPIRLTPMTPRTEEGARIAMAWNMSFRGPNSEFPDGAYRLTGDEYDYTYDSGVSIVLPTVPDKIYVMDCRALHYDGWLEEEHRYREVEVEVRSPSGNMDVRSDEGHIVHAFVAEEDKSRIDLVFVDESVSTYRSMVFWGCDFGPAT